MLSGRSGYVGLGLSIGPNNYVTKYLKNDVPHPGASTLLSATRPPRPIFVPNNIKGCLIILKDSTELSKLQAYRVPSATSRCHGPQAS